MPLTMPKPDGSCCGYRMLMACLLILLALGLLLLIVGALSGRPAAPPLMLFA